MQSTFHISVLSYLNIYI